MIEACILSISHFFGVVSKTIVDDPHGLLEHTVLVELPQPMFLLVRLPEGATLD